MSIIAKYKFDKTIYADLLPEFNAEFTSDKYNTTDEEVDGIITRTIESDELPTLMRFGRVWVEGESSVDNRTDSLLEVLTMNTSGLTDCHSMFRYNANLTSIDCEWDTSNVTRISNMFAYCTNLTSLDVSNFNTSKVADMSSMFYGCTNLTSLDVSNFNTSNVTDMNNMFYNCNNLTSLDVSNFDTSNVTNMNNLFDCCLSLTEIHGISNWDTSNVTNMVATFGKCESLIELNLSGWDISSVTNADNLFGQCFSLVTLDISNFKFSTNCIITNIFNENLGNIPLADIGMLYCDQSTINKIASLLPTDHNITIWVEDVDIKDLTPVEGVEFKQYAKDTEIMLTSPLLEGDKLVVKDGKLYHWHKMGKVVLDGSESWSKPTTSSGGQVDTNWETETHTGFRTSGLINPKSVIWGGQQTCICDRFKVGILNDTTYSLSDEYIGQNTTWLDVKISKSKLSTQDTAGFKQWLQANPITVVYELASPQYELISEDPLTISLIAESSDITNSSNIPLNMTINNKGLSTIAMSPSTTYTVAFDKDTDNEVVVNLCGNEITTTDNIVEITTPSEINDELIFYGDGVEVSNVRLLEGSVSGDSIPRESFEGLKNSFEDGYIPESELVDFPTDIYLNGSSFQSGNGDGCNVYYHTVSLKTNTIYTVFCNINEETTCTDGLGLRLVVEVGDKHYNIISGDLTAMKGVFCSTFTLTNTLRETNNLEIWNRENGVVSISNMTILEGDWTHLTEEDWNNLGKYKVEYKVTGKNKYNKDKYPFGDGYSLANSSTNTEGLDEVTSRSEMFKLLPNTTYTYSADLTLDSNVGGAELFVLLYNDSGGVVSFNSIGIASTGRYSITFSTDSVGVYCELRFDNNFSKTGNEGIVTIDNIQLEEGSVATPYEPYKSYTKTFYLNSPLLEGDTIEDIDGKATHVKRYEKIVLDGSESWNMYEMTDEYPDVIGFYLALGFDAMKEGLSGICDRFITLDKDVPGYINTNNEGCVTSGSPREDGIDFIKFVIKRSKLSTTDTAGFKQWLQANPTTVVYEPASPIYETRSTESILCDSYVNGHLDVDTNIPIEKTVFRNSWVETKYLIPNTDYILQFEADNNGKIDAYHLGGTNLNNQNVTKGLNTVRIASTNNIINTRVYLDGIGFNASNIQVVATDRNVNFGYFKGLQSSFEDNNVKNLWDGTLVKGAYISSTEYTYGKDISETRSACIKCKPNTTYVITATNNNRLRIGHVSELVEGIVCMAYDVDDTNISYKEFTTTNREGYLVVYIANESNTNENITVDIREKTNEVKCKVIGKNKFDKSNVVLGYWGTDSTTYHTDIPSVFSHKTPIKVKPNTWYTMQSLGVAGNVYVVGLHPFESILVVNNSRASFYTNNRTEVYIQINTENTDLSKFLDIIQLEEGTEATSYEPYQEYTKTIYLNSPLLKGDTIEVHNGKLCHYHKMGMVVLDGSEDFWVIDDNFDNVKWFGFVIEGKSNSARGVTKSDKFPYSIQWGDLELIQDATTDSVWECNTFIAINKSKISTLDTDGFKQWLSENPTTVVYELASPY